MVDQTSEKVRPARKRPNRQKTLIPRPGQAFDLRRVGPRQNVLQIVPPRAAWRHAIPAERGAIADANPFSQTLEYLTGPWGGRHFRNVVGSQIANPQTTNIYLGDFWGDEPAKVRLEEFSRAIVENGYLDPLQELSYGTGSGVYLGWVNLPWETKLISDVDVRKIISSKIDEGVLHANEDTLYVFILHKGVVATFGDGSRSDDRFSGYHDALPYGGIDIAYIVLPSPWDSPQSDGDPFDVFTSAYAHELAETVTDKIPGKGWVSEDGQENADLEAGGLLPWGPPNDPKRFTVQAYYTNERGPTNGAWRDTIDSHAKLELPSGSRQARMRVNQFSVPNPLGVVKEIPSDYMLVSSYGASGAFLRFGIATPGYKNAIYVNNAERYYFFVPMQSAATAPPYWPA